MPGESGVRSRKPFSRSDCGVSRKMKYSYSEPNRGRNPSARARRPTRRRSCRGDGSNGEPSAFTKSRMSAAVSGSQGITRAVAGSTTACASG